MRVISRAADETLLDLEAGDARLRQKGNDLFRLRRNLGTDPVAGEKQQLEGGHVEPHRFVVVAAARRWRLNKALAQAAQPQ